MQRYKKRFWVCSLGFVVSGISFSWITTNTLNNFKPLTFNF